MPAGADVSLTSDMKSTKSNPRQHSSQPARTVIKGSKSATVGTVYEPMRHKRPDMGDRPNAVEQVRQIEDLRTQKDAIQRAFSEEKHRNINLAD